MSLFKCKMCGGDLEIAEGVTIAECEYCGTKQTVPKAMDENLQNLFNRANTLRIKSEFDKAEKLYEKIIQADTTQSEAYWGLILCKYGIEYVDDPATFKKIPTCHRASYDSIIADDDYKSALENADMSQRAIYEEQAKEIDRIQKDILTLAQKEETYDVFICYKETDADGHRTQDSVIANDIYYQLMQEGFKVFYAAITLEGKLGSAYEPIIFAALNSAKVMLSIGTKPEYFNAVWVKNEWSRFLKIIKKDRSKLLIPCYRDMDAYELPEEFAHLQAQDMAKIGFINDLVRGIKKVVKKDEPKQNTVVKETVVTTTNATVAPLLKRAFMFLEDGDWTSADEYCEKVLDQDPECAQAYLGKLMVELHVRKQDRLKDCSEPFDNNNFYKKTIRFADETLKSSLSDYIEHIKSRNESNRLEGIYQSANNAYKMATSENEYKEVAHTYESIRNYRDASELAKKCYEEAEIARKDHILLLGDNEMNGGKIKNYESAIKYFTSILGWKDSDEKINICHRSIEELKEEFEKTKQIRQQKSILSARSPISLTWHHALAIKENGTVISTPVDKDDPNYCGQCDVEDWKDIVAVVAGEEHSIGLKGDGTVIATQYTNVPEYYAGQCDVSEWRNIIAIAAGEFHSVGLKADGTVVATKYIDSQNDYCGQCDVSEWKDVVAIAAGFYHTVALKTDGTVVCTKYLGSSEDYKGQCETSTWENIVAIAAGDEHTVGLRADGRVVSTKYQSNDGGYCGEGEVNDWTDIVAVSAGAGHTVGIKSDGTVIATKPIGKKEEYHGECDVEGWHDVVAISAGIDSTLALDLYGNIVCTEYLFDGDEESESSSEFIGGLSISELKDIYMPPKHSSWSELLAFEREQSLERHERYSLLATESESEKKEDPITDETNADGSALLYRQSGVCQHCGGTFKKGLFAKKCSKCGKAKDY